MEGGDGLGVVEMNRISDSVWCDLHVLRQDPNGPIVEYMFVERGRAFPLEQSDGWAAALAGVRAHGRSAQRVASQGFCRRSI